jgi:hypothetical protein
MMMMRRQKFFQSSWIFLAILSEFSYEKSFEHASYEEIACAGLWFESHDLLDNLS